MSNAIKTEEEYKFRLASHDWHGAYADEQRVWKKWHEETRNLLDAASELDKNFAIWNRYAPEMYRK